MKDEDVSFKGARYTGKEKNDFFCIEIVDYAKKVYALHHHVLGLTDLLKDYEDDNTFKKAAKEAFKDYAEEALAKWKDKYGDNDPNEEFAQWGEDLFTKKKALRLFKRKLAAMYLVKVAESDLNKENKFLSLGYGESDIVDSKVQTTFNWKNMMTRFDHKGTFGNKFMIYLMDGIWEPIKSKFQNPVKSYKENKIWADQSGQILFSENDGSTLHFNGAKLESESQSNLGNREQLSVEKDLAEIRKCKADMQDMRRQMHEEITGSYYVRDMNRIILSAPEIILGNVDTDGILYEGSSSKIIVRGTEVDLQATGNGGRVATRAASIHQIAEDPGTDGLEHVVGSLSEIVSQARSIVIQSDDAQGAFATPPTSNGGLRIHADKQLEISATQASENKEKLLDLQIQGETARLTDQRTGKQEEYPSGTGKRS